MIATPRPHFDPSVEKAAYAAAAATMADQWVAGGCGSEEPMLTRDGRWVLRVFNFRYGQHGWLDLGTDVVTADKSYRCPSCGTALAEDPERVECGACQMLT
jgi:ribosomal protein S27AE